MNHPIPQTILERKILILQQQKVNFRSDLEDKPMRDDQISAGFSDLKSEFKAKTRTKTELGDLKVCFSFDDNALCVHEVGAAHIFMILALCNQREKRWCVILRNNGAAEKLIRHLTRKFNSENILKGTFALFYKEFESLRDHSP